MSFFDLPTENTSPQGGNFFDQSASPTPKKTGGFFGNVGSAISKFTHPSPAVTKAVDSLKIAPKAGNFFDELNKGVSNFKGSIGNVNVEKAVASLPEKLGITKSPITDEANLNPSNINIKIPFTGGSFISIPSPFSDPGTPTKFNASLPFKNAQPFAQAPQLGDIGKAENEVVNFFANVPSAIIQAIPRALETVYHEAKVFGKPNAPVEDLSKIGQSLYGSKQYAPVNTDISNRIKNGDGVLSAYLGGISTKVLDVAVGADVFARGATTLSKVLDTPSDFSKVEAWKTLGSPSTPEEAQANYRKLAQQLHPDKTGGSDVGIKVLNQARNLLGKDLENIPSAIDTLKSKASQYLEWIGRQTKLKDPVLTPNLKLRSEEKGGGRSLDLKQIPERTGIGAPEDLKAIAEEVKVSPKPEPVMPEEYSQAIDSYKQNTLGEKGTGNLEALIKQAETPKGKAFVASQVKSIPKNSDGTVTIYRVGEVRGGNMSATLDPKMADVIAKERTKQGLPAEVSTLTVKPENIRAVVPGFEKEVIFSQEEPKLNEKRPRKTLPERLVEPQRVAEYKQRLKLRSADPVLVNTIITPGSTAWGASVGGHMIFENVVQVFTEDHEMMHQVMNNLDKIALFKKFDKAELYSEARDLYGKDLSDKELEEKLAYDFQQYVRDREANRPSGFFDKVLDFFRRLYASLKQIFRNDTDVQEFYRVMTEGKASEETIIPADERINNFVENARNTGIANFRLDYPNPQFNQEQEAIYNFNEKVPEKDVFNDEGDLTLKTITKLEGRTTVSKQFIEDLTNSGDIKQVERDLIREALKTEGDKVNVKEFTDKVKVELLPLKIENEGATGLKHEGVTLPKELRGNVKNYDEHVYESPIKTSAGNIHFQGTKYGTGVQNYFGHTRIEDMADEDLRRVIEVQSDLYQKGNLENNIRDPEDARFFVERGKKGLEGGEPQSALDEANQQQKLRQYNDPTAHFRMVREEVKQAAKDGKTKLQFPTGETAMKIEGLGEQNNWSFFPEETPDKLVDLKPSDLKVGLEINMSDRASHWVVTEITGDGKFNAIPMRKLQNVTGEGIPEKLRNPSISNYTEAFDISGKVDTSNPIYRFYEKDLGRYLKNNYDAKPVTDDKGVTWYEVPITKEMATLPVPAFNERPGIPVLRKELETAQGYLDMAVANQEVFGDKIPELKAKVDDLRKQIQEAKFPVAQTAREALANAEKRVGAKPAEIINKLTNQLIRAEESLKAAERQPEAHKKAYGEDRVPRYKEQIKDLRERISGVRDAEEQKIKKVIVSGKEVELPIELQNKQLSLQFRQEAHEDNPVSKLSKYVLRRGENAGSLPELGVGKSKFAKEGDAIIQEIIGTEGRDARNMFDENEVIARFEKWQREDLLLKEEEKELKKEINNFVLEKKDEIGIEKLTNQTAKRIETEVSKIRAEQKLKQKTVQLEKDRQKKELEEKGKKYGFTIPDYQSENYLPDIPELIGTEDALRRHPAVPLMKYVNQRTGLLPEIDKDHPGVYGKKIQEILDKKEFSSIKDAQKSVDNYLAHVQILEEKSEDLLNPIQMNDSPTVNETLAYQTEKERNNNPNAESLGEMLDKDKYPLSKKVGFHDILRTPDRVFEKIGLKDEVALIKKSYRKYLIELPKNIDKISSWAKRTPKEGASERIFDYLNGTVDENGFLKPPVLEEEEVRVAEEMKSWLEDWARRLKLKPHQRIENYITHIFEEDLSNKEFPEELAKIIRGKIPGEVYNPFLEKRLGQMGYVRDAFRALDAYVKRATRKVNMDPALEKLKIAAKDLDLTASDYVQRYIENVNLRPSNLDKSFDVTLKQIFGTTFGQRPTARITRAGRRLIFRAFIGLNPKVALANLGQGVNTYSKLGEKYTIIGYSKLLNGLNQQELIDNGILNADIIQDKSLSATKKFWEKTDKVLFYLFETAEKINRGAAYFGAKAKYTAENSKLAKTEINGKSTEARIWKEGASEEKAIDYARQIVEDTQFTFGSVDTPPLLQGDLAKTIFQFQSFGLKQAEFLSEMAKSKNYAGLLRWVAASLGFLLLIGRAFGMKPKDLIPFSRFGTPPLLALPVEIIKAIFNVPDKFGNIPTLKQKIANVERPLIGFIPAGLQGQKTLKGIKSISQGESPTLRSKVQALAFGPKNLSDTSVGQQLNKNIKAAQTKVDNLDSSVVKIVKPIYNEVKKVGFGSEEGDALVADLSDQEYEVFKDMRAIDKAKDALILEPKVLPIVRKANELGFGSDAADKYLEEVFPDTPEGDKEYAVFKTVKSVLYPSGNETPTGDGSVAGKWDKQNLAQHIWNIADAVGTSPVTAFKDIFGGNSSWRIVGKTNGQIMVERMPLETSTAIRKAQGVANSKNFILDHTVPLEVGGNNNKNNLQILSREDWENNSPVENYLGKALKAGKITGSQAREYIIRYKAGAAESLSKILEKEYKKKYKGIPLTFDEIKELVK